MILPLLLLALASPAHASQTRVSHSPLKYLHLAKKSAAALEFTDVTVTRPVGPGSNETFNQRVFFSSTYAENTSSPVIFYLTGEWANSHGEVDAVVGELAQQLKAYVVSAEHRFYGESQPARPNGLAEDDLEYLNTELAIEDLSAAQKQVMATYGLKGKWFTYGISYAATLATYYRLAHPELASGALAFSAPLRVLPKGFDTYEAVAVSAFGPDLTAQTKRAASYIMGQTTTPEGRQWIQTKFSLKNADFTADDIAAILVTDIAQFAQDGAIDTLKTSLAGAQTDADLANGLIVALTGILGTEFWHESPYGARNDAGFLNDDDRWSFQSFTQYGWLYVTSLDPALSFMPGAVKMDYYEREYGKAFGASYSSLMFDFSARMEDKIKTSGSRLLLINGSFDPWSSISYPALSDPSRGITPVLVTGGHHGAGAGPFDTDPSSAVYSAQQQILKVLKSWL